MPRRSGHPGYTCTCTRTCRCISASSTAASPLRQSLHSSHLLPTLRLDPARPTTFLRTTARLPPVLLRQPLQSQSNHLSPYPRSVVGISSSSLRTNHQLDKRPRPKQHATSILPGDNTHSEANAGANDTVRRESHTVSRPLLLDHRRHIPLSPFAIRRQHHAQQASSVSLARRPLPKRLHYPGQPHVGSGSAVWVYSCMPILGSGSPDMTVDCLCSRLDKPLPTTSKRTQACGNSRPTNAIMDLSAP